LNNSGCPSEQTGKASFTKEPSVEDLWSEALNLVQFGSASLGKYWPMNSITPALNSAGWLLNMLWLAPAMFSRLTSGRNSSSLSVTAVSGAGVSAP
jgi:hypothetical protein